MSKGTKVKFLKLCDELKSNVKMDCYLISPDVIIELSKMLKRHIKKELK